MMMVGAAGDVLDAAAGSSSSPFAVLGLLAVAIPAGWVLIRWMSKYQREMTEYYVADNDRLRAENIRLDKVLNETVKALNKVESDSAIRIAGLEIQVLRLTGQVEDLQRRLDER